MIYHLTDGIIMMSIDPMKKEIALVIIDLQKKFVITTLDDREKSFNRKLDNVNILSDMFRKAGRPVIFVKFRGEGHDLYKGTDGDDILESVTVGKDDIFVDKRHMNSFRESDLEKTIRSVGCDAALLCGMVSEYCVTSTYYAAFDHDITPYFAKDACISTNENINDALNQILKTMDIDETRAYLKEHSR